MPQPWKAVDKHFENFKVHQWSGYTNLKIASVSTCLQKELKNMILSSSENTGLFPSLPSDSKHYSINISLSVLKYRHKLLEPGNTQDVLHELPTIRCQPSHRNEGGSCREIITRSFLKQSPGKMPYKVSIIRRSTQVWQKEWDLLHAPKCTSISN